MSEQVEGDKELAIRPDIRELLQFADLVGVRFLEVRGTAKPEPGDEDAHSQVSFQVREIHAEDRIEVRFKAGVDHYQAVYEFEVATLYKFSRPIDFDESLIRNFIEMVAIMAAFPYIREVLSTTAARLELDVPILGILRQGEFSMDEVTE